jgi:hypothetical protein
MFGTGKLRLSGHHPATYENNIVSSKKSVPQTPDSEIDNSQVILPGPGAQG